MKLSLTKSMYGHTVNIILNIDSKAAIDGEMLDDQIVEATQKSKHMECPVIFRPQL